MQANPATTTPPFLTASSNGNATLAALQGFHDLLRNNDIPLHLIKPVALIVNVSPTAQQLYPIMGK